MNAGFIRDNKLARKLWYKISPAARYQLRKLFFLPVDMWDLVNGAKHRYVPSRGAVFTGGTAGAIQFLKDARQQVTLLEKYADLKKDDHILDIGCGVGRTAIGLSEYLDSTARYEGFDPVQKGIDWCKKGIGRDFNNFSFTHVSLFNDLYSKSGDTATSFKFPYHDDSFDTIFSFSVFTHMSVNEIENYLQEINRCRKNDATCLSTFFLYNDDNENHIATKPGFHFPVKRDGYRLMSESTVSGNIAIHEDVLKKMMVIAGFTTIQIIPGFWKGLRNQELKEEYQDIVIFK